MNIPSLVLGLYTKLIR